MSQIRRTLGLPGTNEIDRTEPRLLEVKKTYRVPLYAGGILKPGRDEFEIGMAIDPVTKKAIPGSGQKVFVQLYDKEVVEYVLNPKYYEPVTEVNGKGETIVTSFKKFGFIPSNPDGSMNRFELPKVITDGSANGYASQADAQRMAEYKERQGMKAEFIKMQELIQTIIDGKPVEEKTGAGNNLLDRIKDLLSSDKKQN